MDANASYVIDIAAAMPAGEQTIAQLDALTAKLMGGGKGADHFQKAMVDVSTALDNAKAAHIAAKDALAAGNEEYGILERAALQAAKAAERAALKGVIPPEVAATAMRTAAAVDAYANELRQLEQAAERASAEEKQLAQTMSNVKRLASHVDKTFAGQAETLEKMSGALGQFGGPLGALGQGVLGPAKGFTELSGAIGKSRAVALLGAAAVVGLTAAVVALSVAAVAGVAALAAWAVKLADGARNAELAREAFAAMNPELAAMSGELRKVASDLQLGDSVVQGLAKSLQEAKVSAEDMPAALRAAALSEKALAGGGAEFVAQVKAGKKSVAELAATAQSKLGGVVAKQLRGLDAQSERLSKNIGGIFGGLNIEPVLSAMETLVGLFDENTAAGQTIKFLFETIFQPLINQAEKAAYVIEAFALGFLIGLTRVYIAVKPAIKAVAEFFGFEDTSLADTLDLAKRAGELVVPAFLVFAGILGSIAIAVGGAVAALVGIQVAIYSMVAAVAEAGVAIMVGIVGAWNAVTAFLGGINLADMGRNLILGLVNGITGAAGFVKDAVTNAVNGAIASAKSALGIASPSKVFAEIGEFTSEGFVRGVDDTAGDAQDALANMVEPSSALSKQDALGGNLSAAPAPAPAASGGGTVSGNTFNFYGVKDAEDALDKFNEALTKLLEGDAAQVGETVPA